MQVKDRFCCVSCGSMFMLNEADLLFRTGFFRGVHPLGCCRTCSSTLSSEEMLEWADSLSQERNPNMLSIPTRTQYTNSAVPEMIYSTNDVHVYS